MGLASKLEGIVESEVTPYIVLSVFSAVMVSPIILIFFNSFKTLHEALSWPPTIIPSQPTLEAYIKVINSPVLLTLRNSLIIASGTTFLVLALGLPTAYGISKYSFKGSKFAMLFFLASRIIPPLSLLIPFYIMMTWLKLTNTFQCLIILDTYLAFPLMVWILKAFFDEFERDLIDAALVDGCSRLGAFLRVAIPLSAVGIAAVGIITFLWTWNEFVYAMIFTATEDIAPVTIGIFHFVGDEVIEWNSLSAVGIFTSLPAIIFFIFAQKYIIEGMTKGAIKL